MIHAGADDRKAQRYVDTLYGLPGLQLSVIDKAHCLQRDMSLIVVHAHHDVVPAAQSLGEDAVWRNGADGVDAFCLCRLDGRLNLLDLLCAEEAVLTAVGIQTGYGYLRVLDSHIFARLVGDFDYLQNAGLLYPVAGLPEGDVGGNVNHSQVVVG